MNRTLLLRLLLLAFIAAGVALGIVYREHFSREALEAWIGALGIWAPLVYMGVYALGTLFVAGAALTLVGGALFGPVWGVLYVLIGSVSGATLAFLLARYLAADWVERHTRGILLQVKEGVEAEGWHFVAFVRLVPLFPFILLNYALGLTRIPLRTYIAGSAIFMLPGIAGYVYLGYAGREALLGGEDVLKKVLLAVAVFAALVFLPLLVRRLRAVRKGSASPTTMPGAEGTGAPGGAARR
jgi:uncharacterized membrane protein YdjX (TVP38/TMEM64 family)